MSHLQVDGKDIPVVAVSYLGLGSNDARGLMQVANDAGSFCFPNNTAGRTPAVYLPTAVRPVNASTAMYSWSRCAHAYDSVITSVGALHTAAAPVPPAQLRTLPGFAGTTFMGLGSIPLIATTLGAGKARDMRTAIREKVTQTCRGPGAWSRAAALYPASLVSFADTLCSTGTFEHQLIFSSTGVGIRPDHFALVDPTDPLQPDWIAGYATTRLDP